MNILDARGATPSGDRLARIVASPNYRDGEFKNPVAARLMVQGSTRRMLWRQFTGKEERVPKTRIPIVQGSAARYETPPESGLRATWLGHSSILVEMDGTRILIDPVLSRRASPSEAVGPKRFHPAPMTVRDLPPIDIVLITHDHYDHLDMRVIRDLVKSDDQRGIRYITALGVGAHLEHWGVRTSCVTELDWGEATTHGGVTFTACPARHFSGRAFKRNQTLWASWAMSTAQHRIFHSGDTGYFDGFAATGAEFGPFDLTMIKIGAYDELWPDIHVNPEEAVRIHGMLKGRVLLPIHWGTFNLAMHDWREPIERLLIAAQTSSAPVVTPIPGDWLEPAAPPAVNPWWRDLNR